MNEKAQNLFSFLEKVKVSLAHKQPLLTSPILI